MSDKLEIDDSGSLLLLGGSGDLLLGYTLEDLLSDKGAAKEIVIKGQYLDETDTLQTEWISQTGWDDQIDGPAGTHIPPLLTTNLRIDQRIDPLELLSSLATFGDIELSNNHLGYAGRYDRWRRYSVDGQLWTVYAVGELSNGARIELADVIDTPLYRLQGINIPEVGSDTCLIRARSLSDLDTALQPVTYSPPALSFPGTAAGMIDFGNNLDITGVQSISVWVYLTDPVSTAQFIAHKDSGAAGYYIAVGLVGGGTIAAGVEIAIRGQSPATTTTAANVLQAFRWHRIDISIDTTSRRIDIDGTTAITTAGVTGTPTASATSLSVGYLLAGRMHRLIYWSNARSNAVMAIEGRVPITGDETNLREAFLFGEGSGDVVASSKAGSSLSGDIGDGVIWDTATWNYQGILGQHEPYVLGTVPRVPVTWIDPPNQIGQVSKGPIALLSELQSNHNAVSTANYTVDILNGTLTVISGALSGTYSATVTANNLWQSALYFDGIASRASVAYTMPAGSKYLGCHFRCDDIKSTTRVIASWPVSTGLSRLNLNMISGNFPQGQTANDAGTVFTVTCPFAIRQGRRYSIIVSVDIANPTTGLNLYLDGVVVATTAITGAFTGTQPTLGIGHRASLVDLFFKGVIDEVVVGNTACTLAMAELFHSLPSTSSFTGIAIGWHMDEAAGASALPFTGSGTLSLTSLTWTAGRSAPTDLARAILYASGYIESDLDADSWFTALTQNSADCGWFVSGGVRSLDVLNTILGGLGFIIYRTILGSIKIKRFDGVSGTSDIDLDADIDLQSQPIESLAADPAIYQWIISYATNNSKQDPANIAGSLASTDPDRYQYGSMVAKSVPKSDGSILSRFPGAQTRARTTALLNLSDAEDEAARLLTLHSRGADRKSIPAFAAVRGIELLNEIGPLMEECDLDEGNSVVVGITLEDGAGTLIVWREG